MIEYAVRVYADGDKVWYLNGKLHREDGPACEYANGYKFWYLNDQLHREDGPAVEYPNGDKRWWLNGVKYTEEEFNKKTSKTVELTVSEICERLGYNVKVVK